MSTGWGALLSSMPVSRLPQPSNGLLVIPSPRRSGGMMGCAVPAGRWGQSEGSTTPRVGVMTCTTRTGQLFG